MIERPNRSSQFETSAVSNGLPSTQEKPVAPQLPITPLLDQQSYLDDRLRNVVRRVAEAEYAKILSLPTDDPLDPKRRSRVELTRTEMLDQPAAIEATLHRNTEALTEIAQRVVSANVERVFLVGAGDSLAVMVAARHLLEAMLNLPCEPVQSLDFAYYMDGLIDSRTLVVALSSSGETTRTVEAALVAQHAGALTLALTNTEDSTLMQECNETLVIEATRKGWPTQASTAALALLQRLSLHIGSRKGHADLGDLGRAVSSLPQLMADLMERSEEHVADIARREAKRALYLFAGGGPSWASAIIGAAKVRECSPDHAMAIQLEEYHHYNSQKPGDPIWVVAPDGRSLARAADTCRDAVRYQGQLYVVATHGQTAFDGFTNDVIRIPEVPELISPMLSVVPVQMFGYHVAAAKFAMAEFEAG
jgi:glutamine---fructose-6-phosphate transaminase (isomerizing)